MFKWICLALALLVIMGCGGNPYKGGDITIKVIDKETGEGVQNVFLVYAFYQPHQVHISSEFIGKIEVETNEKGEAVLNKKDLYRFTYEADNFSFELFKEGFWLFKVSTSRTI